MVKKRFSRVSLLAMSVMCLGTAWAMLWETGGGESMRYRGLPFPWLAQTDVVGIEYYRWGGLAADIIIWFVVIAGVGWLTQRLTSRASNVRRTHEQTHAAKHQA